MFRMARVVARNASDAERAQDGRREAAGAPRPLSLAHELAHVVAPLSGSPAVVQRTLEARHVRREQGAFPHSRIEQEGDLPDVVARVGLWPELRGVERVAGGEFVMVDPQQRVESRGKAYVLCLRGAGGPAFYVNEQHLAQYGPDDHIAGTSLIRVTSGGKDAISWPRAGKPGLRPISDAGISYLKNVVLKLKAGERKAGVTVRNIDQILSTILDKDPGQLENTGAGLWEYVPSNLEQMRQRVDQDRSLLEGRNLITAGHKLTGVEFSGADFHKRGQQVLFLTFSPGPDATGDERRIVYKPSSIELDAALFGRDPATVAAALDPQGESIGTYEILPRKTEGGGYGYQEFVESAGRSSSQRPETREDLIGVYRSIGATAAMSYLVGLEDVHRQNVLLLKNRIQLIDMEATTGVFDPSEATGFTAQQWPDALAEIREQLVEFAGVPADALPGSSQAADEAEAAFTATLQRGSAMPVEGIAKARARFVPLATENFRLLGEVIRSRTLKLQKKNENAEFTLEDWKKVIQEPEVLQQARGMTTISDADMQAILGRQAVFDALKREEVPVFTRDLASQLIYDEAGEPFTVKRHPKVGPPIAESVASRLDEPATSVALTLFRRQILEQIVTINEKLRGARAG